jgi:hypothetical protein
MDSALAQHSLQPAIPANAHRNNDDNYVSEFFAQLTNSEFLSDSSDINNFNQKDQHGNETGADGPEKRGTNCPAKQQDIAQDHSSGNSPSGESFQNHPGNDLDIGGAAPFDFNALDFDFLDFGALSQFDNIFTPFTLPEAASSIYAGVNVLGNDNNNFLGTPQGINPPVENPNIRIPETPLPINHFSSYLRSAQGGLVNNPYVDTPLNNTPGGITRQVPGDISMMPMFYNPHPFSALQGSSSANLLPSVGCQPQPSPTGSNAKRRRRSASPPAPQNTFQFVHDERSMPPDFRANPNNHGRFKYHRDGTREYLNAPKNRRKRRCSDRV